LKHERYGKMSDDKVGHLVITGVVEDEFGGVTYTFDVDDKTAKQVAELGLKLVLICGAYDLDIEDVLEALHDKGKEQSV
jgi:predicted Kef-type K+ transport protein